MKLKQSRQKILLRFIYIGVPLCIFLVVVLVGFFKAGIDFKRVQLAGRDTYNQSVLQQYRLEHSLVNDTHYVSATSEGASFKGDMLFLRGLEGKKRLDFYPHLKGKFSSYIEFLVMPKEQTEKIHIQLFQNKKRIAAQDFSQKGIYSLCHDLTLTKDDKFTIIASGQGVILLGNPIFYMKKPVTVREYVFLICADTLRADHLPTYGYQRETAPNIHDFSRDGVVFENAYSQSPWTLPSHMSLFTSLNEYNHGVKKGGTLSIQKDFFVEELSGEFVTRSINGGGWVAAQFGFYRGFDLYKSYGRCGANPDSAKTLFEKANEDLKKHNFPKTFYFLHSYQIHTPYQPRRKYVTYFNPKPKHKMLVTPIHLNNKKISPQEGKKIKEPMIDLYDGEIRAFDHWFGEFLRFLKKEKIYNRAMIIFMSDHGEEFFEHRKWGHGHSLYNEVARVPLIIKFPKSRFKGLRVKAKVGLIDIMPTILELYHVDFRGENGEEGIDGRDLIPLVKGKSLNRPIISSITSGFYSPADAIKIAIFQDNYKIICDIPYKKTRSLKLSSFSAFKKMEFFDLLTDPAETVNLYLKKMRQVKKFQPLLDGIIVKGINHLRRKGKEVVIDKEMQDALKSLGYL